MFAERLGGFAIGVGENDFGQVLSHGVEKRACLLVYPVVENLSEVTKAIKPRNHHSQTFPLSDLITDPGVAVNAHLRDASLFKCSCYLFCCLAADPEVC